MRKRTMRRGLHVAGEEPTPDPVVRALCGYREAVREFLDARDRQRGKPALVLADGSDPNAGERARIDALLKLRGAELFAALVEDLDAPKPSAP